MTKNYEREKVDNDACDIRLLNTITHCINK